MDKFQYLNILKTSLKRSIENFNIEAPIFQQDNDPKPTTKLVLGYLESRNFETMSWPPQSPDLSPIENLWGIIQQKLGNYVAKNDDELWAKVKEIWYSITKEECQKLILSMQNRLTQLYKNKGMHIDY